MKTIKLASGRDYEIPMFDPVVATHFANAASNTATLLSEINDKQIYAPLFKDKQALVFLDIGANIGLVSLYAVENCRKIVAVEPAPDTFTVLKALTHKFPQIECVNAALTTTEGPTEFYVNDLNTTASSTVNTYGTIYNVRGLTLRNILSIHQLEHVDVAKIDVEGAEGESLTFHELEMADSIIDRFWIEVHNCPVSTWNKKMADLISHFGKLGYKTETNGMVLQAYK